MVVQGMATVRRQQGGMKRQVTSRLTAVGGGGHDAEVGRFVGVVLQMEKRLSAFLRHDFHKVLEAFFHRPRHVFLRAQLQVGG